MRVTPFQAIGPSDVDCFLIAVLTDQTGLKFNAGNKKPGQLFPSIFHFIWKILSSENPIDIEEFQFDCHQVKTN